MKLIYIAGKYGGATHSDIDDNIQKAEHAEILLICKGWAVICPHKNTAHFEIYEEVGPGLGWQKWMDMYLEILSRCDAIFLLKGWHESKGSNVEHRFATEHNIPVFMEQDGYPDPQH